MAKGLLELQIQGNVREESRRLQTLFLETLGWKGIRRLEQFATVTAARAVQDEVRAAAPGGRNGRMGKAIRGRKSRLFYPGAIVGPVAGKKGAWFAWFVVKGTKPHMIPSDTVGRRVAMAFGGTVAARVQHPGAKPNNFVTPTVESNLNQVMDAFGATITMMVTDEARRLHILGLGVAYKNGTAAKWQSMSWARDWKNPDKMEPVNIGGGGALSGGARASGTLSPIPQIGSRK